MCQRPFLVLHDPDFVKQITIKDFDKFTDHFVSAYVRTACNVYAFETSFTQLTDKCVFHVMDISCLTSQYRNLGTTVSHILYTQFEGQSPYLYITYTQMSILPFCLHAISVILYGVYTSILHNIRMKQSKTLCNLSPG